MTTKHFILYNIPFTQRSADNFIDITAIFIAKNKIFSNYARIKAAKENFDRYENSIIKSNKHTWCDPRCLKPIIEWLVKPSTIDFSTIQKELDNPYFTEETIEIKNTKICSKCHEELSIDNFDKNKLKPDNLDIRCKSCYKIDRDKDEKNKERALDYYEQNKEKCIKKKSEWNKNNKEKVNIINRRCYEKKKAQKEEQILKESEEEAKNIINNMTLINKNDKSYSIICRESDGYIDVTNLCKAGGRLFSTWSRKTTTKEFLKILEDDIKSEYQKNTSRQNCTDLLINPETPQNKNDVVMTVNIQLIKTETKNETKSEYQKNLTGQYCTVKLILQEQGGNGERHIWVHPKVAINIAQWISPKFDVQVTKWVHQLLVVGTVKLTDGSSDKDIIDIQRNKIKYNRLKTEGNEDEADDVKYEINNKLLELEIKNKDLENKLSATLDAYNKQSKSLQRQRRIQYNPEKVIYLLRHKEFKNMYKVGIANNLTSRLSTYNTSAPDDFEVIYHEYTIYNDIIEIMIKKKFIEFLYANNKEWYEVNEGPEILMKGIKEGVDYFKI